MEENFIISLKLETKKAQAMNTRKRRFCLLCESDVEIRIVDPKYDDLSEDSFGHDGEDNERFLEKPPLRISGVISRLQELQETEGDLILCVADENALLTMTPEDLEFEVTSKQNYEFSIGLVDDNYLSIHIN